MRRSTVATVVLVALAGSMIGVSTVGANSATAANHGDPWTTMVVVDDPVAGELLRHYRTTSESGQPAQLLGEMPIAGASEVVAEADGSAVWVLGSGSAPGASRIERFAVAADGSLTATGEAFDVGEGARDLVRSPDDRHVYTVNPDANTLTAVDTIAGTVDAFAIPGGPIGIVVAPDGVTAAVITEDDIVHRVDLVTGAVTATRAAGGGFTAEGLVDIELAPEGDAVYIAADGGSGGGAVTRLRLDAALSVEGAGDRDATLGPLEPIGLEIDRVYGDVLVAIDGSPTIERLVWGAATLTPVGNFIVDAPVSAVLTSTPLGNAVDAWVPSAASVIRLEYPSGGLSVPYAAGEARAILIMPGQPVTIDGPIGGSSNAGESVEIMLDGIAPAEDLSYLEWDFHDGAGLATTTQPRVEHEFDAEGIYTVTVRSVSRLGASVEPRFDGRSMMTNGSPEAEAQIIRIVNPAIIGGSVSWTGASDPARTQKYWQIPERTTSLVITAAGRPGLRGTDSAPGVGDLCEIVGESCSNPGADGGGRPTARVTVPVGVGADLLAPGDTLSVVLGHHGASTHGQLLGGSGGTGGGTDGGDGGAGGGGSGVFLESADLQYPWIIAAPGGGGGGGGGLSSFAGVGGSGFMGLSDGALGEGSGETRGTYRAQCVIGVTAFAQRPGGPSAQTLQNGDPGRSTDRVSTGGAGGGGGGCLGAAAGQEESPYPSGGAGGGGGIGYSRYPDATELIGEVAGADSFVGIEWTATAVTTERATVTAADRWRFTLGEAGGFPLTFAGLGASPSEPPGIPAGLEWSCVDLGASIPFCQIVGTPADGTAGVYDLEIEAEGGDRTVRLVIEHPSSIAAAANPVTWRPARQQAIDLTSEGDSGRVLAVRGEMPDWLSFIDGGDGTASLVGTPPAGSDGTYTTRVVVAQDARTLDAEPVGAWSVIEVEIAVVSQTDLAISAGTVPTVREGDRNRSLELTVDNRGIDPSDPGTTTVTVDTGSPDIVARALSGTGWICLLDALVCSRSGSLDAGEAWPAIDVRVDVGVGTTVGPWAASATVDARLDVDVANNTWNSLASIDDVPSPRTTADAYRIGAGRSLIVSEAAGLLANDVGEGPLIAQLVTAPVGGAVQLDPDGSFTFRPNGEVSGPVRFTYQALDRLGQESAVSTATIVVDAEPTIVAIPNPTPEPSPVSSNSSTPVDPEGASSGVSPNSGASEGSGGDRGFGGLDWEGAVAWIVALLALIALGIGFVIVRRRRDARSVPRSTLAP